MDHLPWRIRGIGAGLVLAACLACAAAPPAPAPGRSTLAGRVGLVPPEAAARAAASGAYGDRRMRGVEAVDYSRPGFAVVYVEASDAEESAAGAAHPPARHPVAIVAGAVRVRIEPPGLALRAGSTLVVRNDDQATHVLSAPSLALLAPIEAGRTLEVPVSGPGLHALHLLDQPGEPARVFASPGPYARVADSGRFTLADLAPGRRVVHVWHPRLPPLARTVDLPPDSVVQLDLTLGIAAGAGTAAGSGSAEQD